MPASISSFVGLSWRVAISFSDRHFRFHRHVEVARQPGAMDVTGDARDHFVAGIASPGLLPDSGTTLRRTELWVPKPAMAGRRHERRLRTNQSRTNQSRTNQCSLPADSGALLAQPASGPVPTPPRSCLSNSRALAPPTPWSSLQTPSSRQQLAVEGRSSRVAGARLRHPEEPGLPLPRAACPRPPQRAVPCGAEDARGVPASAL